MEKINENVLNDLKSILKKVKGMGYRAEIVGQYVLVPFSWAENAKSFSDDIRDCLPSFAESVINEEDHVMIRLIF